MYCDHFFVAIFLLFAFAIVVSAEIENGTGIVGGYHDVEEASEQFNEFIQKMESHKPTAHNYFGSLVRVGEKPVKLRQQVVAGMNHKAMYKAEWCINTKANHHQHHHYHRNHENEQAEVKCKNYGHVCVKTHTNLNQVLEVKCWTRCTEIVAWDCTL